MSVSTQTLLLSDLPPTIGAIGAIVAATIAARSGRRNERKLHVIDQAVNGTAEGEPMLRERVEQVAQAVGVDDPPAPETPGG